MTLTASEIRETIIRPSVKAIAMWSPTAEDLILGTGAQESGYRVSHQIGGPALGYWQMEPATHDDLWKTYLAERTLLAGFVMKLLNGASAHASQLTMNPQYACAMARIKYFRVSEPLPDYGDIQGYAKYWKQWYNTPEGAGTPEQFVQNWNAFVG